MLRRAVGTPGRIRVAGLGWLVWLALGSAAWAAPVLVSAGLRFGSSPRLPINETVYFYYHLQNPDDQAVSLRLSLRAAENSRSVFDRTVHLAPRSDLRGRDLVVADAADRYVVSLFRGDERLLRDEIPVSAVELSNAVPLTVLNDHPDFGGSSDLARVTALRESVAVTTVAARLAPHHWSGYGQNRLVAVARPAYRDLSAAQFSALVAYVHRGGTVVFTDPQGALEAGATPWGNLLPVVPLRLRRVDAVPELDALGAVAWGAGEGAGGAVRVPLDERQGFAFLESEARGDGVTILTSGGMPLLRWRDCGLGRVGWVAVEAWHPRLAASGCLMPLWNHILGASAPTYALRNPENRRILPTVLSHLTGFRVPAVGTVGVVLLGYLVVLGVLLVGGALGRRHVLGWLLAAGVGLVLTGLIFAWAFQQSANRPVAGASVLELRTDSGERATSHAIISLFAKKDLRPKVVATAPDVMLRPLPSPAHGKRREPLDAPLLVSAEADRASLHGMTVQALRPRDFAALFESPTTPLTPVSLRFTAGALELAEAGLPEPLARRSERAFLMLPGGFLPVDRDGARLAAIGSPDRLVAVDPFVQDLGRFLTEGAFPRPSVVLIEPAGAADGLPLDLPGLARDGYRVHLLPAIWEVSPGRLVVPHEALQIDAINSLGRLYQKERAEGGLVLRGDQAFAVFDVRLPLPLRPWTTEAVEVDLELGNLGGNIAIEPRLTCTPLSLGAAHADRTAARLWSEARSATSTQGSRRRFEGESLRELVEPLYGSFRLILRVSARTHLERGADAERTNRWRLNHLRLTMTGVAG